MASSSMGRHSAPSDDHRSRRTAIAVVVAVFAVVAVTAVTTLFSYYVSNFSNYSLLYGSLAAVMILMIWLQIVSSILILGGELNDVLIEMNKD